MIQKCLRLLLLAVCASFLFSACQSRPDSYDLSGQPIHFSAYQGKWIVINYWASWCKPCWQEIPALNAFSKDYALKAVVLGVNYREAKPEDLPALAQKLGIQFPVLKTDPAVQLKLPAIQGLPATVLIDPAGKFEQILFGEQTEASLVEAMRLK